MAFQVIKIPTDIEKLERIEGTSFERLLLKIHYYLSINRVAYVLQVSYPNGNLVNGDENNVVENSNRQQSTTRAISIRSHIQSNQPMEYNQNQLKWLEDDYICRGMILNAMSDPIFDIFRHHLTTLELWNAVQA
ncbi:hypothetical protein PanWU01x14_196080, partial [Parasponia andersonii]